MTHSDQLMKPRGSCGAGASGAVSADADLQKVNARYIRGPSQVDGGV
jgi:hypothetical protein